MHEQDGLADGIHYYKRRQSICEHPFGTIKRQWGYTYTLLKGLKKVDGEMNLIMLVYNLKRTITILGFEKMFNAIQNWTPDYNRVVCALTSSLTGRIYSQIKVICFLYLYRPTFLHPRR